MEANLIEKSFPVVALPTSRPNVRHNQNSEVPKAAFEALTCVISLRKTEDQPANIVSDPTYKAEANNSRYTFELLCESIFVVCLLLWTAVALKIKKSINEITAIER